MNRDDEALRGSAAERYAPYTGWCDMAAAELLVGRQVVAWIEAE